MKSLLKYSTILFMLIPSLGSCIPKDDLSGLKPYLRKSVSWKCKTLHREVPLNIYYKEDKATGPEGKNVIVYIRNAAWERIGTESDLSILSDYISQKFIVITLDLGNDDKATSPYIDNDINDIYSAVFGYKAESLLKGINLVPKEYRCYVLPEGYRVANDLVFWEIDKHGAYGSLDRVMQQYNRGVVGNPKAPEAKPVSDPSELKDRNGKPFDYTIRMDIIYPSRTKKKLPAFIYSETSQLRNAHTEPSSEVHVPWFQMRGYVYVVMGHCFNTATVAYWHFGEFTLDHWNGLACYSAALRYLNKNAEKYHIDGGYMGMYGISKGQYAVTRLSDPHNATGTESKKFAGFPEGSPEPQPWQGYPSKLACGWQGMGMGLFEPEYITPDYAPTILACGEHDRDVITQEGTVRFVNRLEELDVNYIYLYQQGLGHMQSWGYDKKSGVDRYQLVIDFFDRYLKVKDKLPPVALMVSPRDSAENVDPSSEIVVHFAPVIDEKSVLEDQAIKVINLKDDSEVAGTWGVSRKGTKFTFLPKQALKNGEEYKIVVTSKVKDKAGTFLEDEKVVKFKVAN
ncbi:MAG: Ig-like domain-containing protein [Mangrovibacterium sp.]|nr:Ig-like domain-containing protein [Mangrovibacterium sp.]